MMRFLNLSPLLAIFLLSRCSAEKTHSIGYTPCERGHGVPEDQCARCLEYVDDTKDDLFVVMEAGHIAIEEDDWQLQIGRVKWNYNHREIANPDNITVSLHMWHPSKGYRGQAVPGCCDVALTSGGCHADQCVDADVYMSIKSGTSMVVGPRHLPPLNPCEKARLVARFFNICVHQPTEWSTVYNCECVVYDSLEGKLLPGNHSSEVQTNAAGLGVWYSSSQSDELIEACQFEMKKDDVLSRGFLVNDSVLMDRALFNRSVYGMPGFNWTQGLVVDTATNRKINCTTKKFNGTDMFKISNPSSPNDTYTCMMPWPNGTSKYRPLSTHVKCMPHTARSPGSKSEVYMMRKEPSPLVSAMVVIVPVCGTAAFTLLACLLGYHWRKKLRRFMKDTKSVPEELDSVMKESLSYYMSDCSCHKDCEEVCQAFDREEKERVSSIRKIQEREESLRCSRTDVLPESHSASLLPAEEPVSERSTKEVGRGGGGRGGGTLGRPTTQESLAHENRCDFVNFSFDGETNACIDDVTIGVDGDSGCPRSLSGHDLRQHNLSNCLHNNARHSSCEVFPSLCHECVGHDQAAKGVYWSKDTAHRGSFYSEDSDESGCGTDSDPDDCQFAEDDVDNEKPTLVTVTSKDSGVSRDYMHVLRDPTPEVNPRYLPKPSPFKSAVTEIA